jgi:hypothetical protein
MSELGRNKMICILMAWTSVAFSWAQAPNERPAPSGTAAPATNVSPRYTLTLPVRAPEPATHVDEDSVMFIGTATVLLRYAGSSILTDPNFLH